MRIGWVTLSTLTINSFEIETQLLIEFEKNRVIDSTVIKLEEPPRAMDIFLGFPSLSLRKAELRDGI